MPFPWPESQNTGWGANGLNGEASRRPIAAAFLVFYISSLMISARYFLGPGVRPSAFWDWVFMLTYWIGHMGLLTLLVMAPLALLMRISPSRVLSGAIFGLVYASALTFILVDTFIFHRYRFHFNGMVLTLLIHGEGQIISLPWENILFIVVVFLLLFIGAILGGKCVEKVIRSRRISIRKTGLLILVAALFSHFVHAAADGVMYLPILKLAQTLPASYPLTGKRMVARFGFEPKGGGLAETAASLGAVATSMNYPLVPLECEPPANRLNVLWIVVDSLRADAMTAEAMPHTSRLADRGHVFTQHYSGSNTTREGIFSLFYGLPGSYFYTARSSNVPPVLMDQWSQSGYDLGIYSSAPLTMPEFHQTVFSGVKDLRKKSQGDSPFARDQDALNDWLSYMDSRDSSRPFFGFLFFDAVHGYSYPRDLKVFTPSLAEINHLDLKPGFDPAPLRNHYLNSVHFVDDLIGKVLKDLEARQLMDSTVIMITSDHGEEFNDNGLNYWGHNSNFSPAQMHVPMILFDPQRESARWSHRTSHYDVPGTFLKDYLGCSTPTEAYSLGRSLFDAEDSPWILVGTHGNMGVILPEQIWHFYGFGYPEIMDYSYRKIDQSVDQEVLGEVLEALSKFQ